MDVHVAKYSIFISKDERFLTSCCTRSWFPHLSASCKLDFVWVFSPLIKRAAQDETSVGKFIDSSGEFTINTFYIPW